MGRRMKTKYAEYDYESTYIQSVECMDEWMAEQLLTRARGVYATKEIVYGNNMDVEIYPEFTRREAENLPKVDKAKERERMKGLNGRKARKYFRRLCECNFTDGDLWITLTYTKVPESIEQAVACMHNFIRNLNGKRKRLGLPNARYIYITESVSEDEERVRVHHHLLMDGLLDMTSVLSMWKYGGRNESRYLKTDENGIAGAAEYMSKSAADTKRRKYEKRWTASRNLIKPEEHKHHQTRSSTVNKMIKDTDKVYTREYMESLRMRNGALRYEGYTYIDSEVRYNTVNGGYYISIRMRREKHENRSEMAHGCAERKDKGRGRVPPEGRKRRGTEIHAGENMP